jgi:hypothetical protein
MESLNPGFLGYNTNWPSLDTLANDTGLGVQSGQGYNFPNYNLYYLEVKAYPQLLKVQFRANASTAANPNCLAESSVRPYNTSYGNYSSYPVTLKHSTDVTHAYFHNLCFNSPENEFYISEPLLTNNNQPNSGTLTSFLDGFAAASVVLFSDINRLVPTTARWISDGIKVYKYHGGGEWSTSLAPFNQCITYFYPPDDDDPDTRID